MKPLCTFHSVAQLDVLDVTSETKPLSTSHLVAQYKDSYLLFRNKYLVSNVVNSRPEDARPLHSYKLKVQGTTIIGMLDSGAQKKKKMTQGWVVNGELPR